MSLSRCLARPMLAAVFVVEGIDTLRNPGPRVKASEDTAPRIAAAVGLPTDPELLVKINAGLQVGAGLLLATGKFRRMSALALLASTVPTTAVGHPFWQSDDPEQRHQQRIHFLKNLAIMSGLILEVVDKEGAPSLAWRARRASRSAGALASHNTKAQRQKTHELSQQAGRAAARAAALAAAGAQAGLAAGGHAVTATGNQSQKVRTRAKTSTDQATKNAKHLAQAQSERAARLWSDRAVTADALQARGRQATHLLEVGSDRASDLAAHLREAGSDRASDLAAHLREAGLERTGHLASHLLEAGSDRASDLLAVAAKQAEAAWQSAADHLPVP